MSEADLGAAPRPMSRRFSLTRWRNRLAASRRFQSWASRMPIARGFARRDGEALFDLLAGFVHAQVLHALVELRILHMMMDGPMAAEALARRAGVPAERMLVLLRAGAALGLMRLRRDGRFALTRQGAAISGVPGLEAMILHHRAFYRDLEDPAGFFRDGVDTELARFWPYVFGAAGEVEPEVAARYSGLMADSQALVAEETLRAVSFRGVRQLMDVGGGSGAFLAAVAKGYPELKGTLFDLPQVVPAAEARFRRAGMADRISVTGGNFREADLPGGADAISLVRVLYDHSDETVRLLLRRARAALPSGGRLIVSEPMTGGARPSRPGDTYFALYTMAMGTGRARSSDEIGRLLRDAGFTGITERPTRRPFVTGVIEARVA